MANEPNKQMQSDAANAAPLIWALAGKGYILKIIHYLILFLSLIFVIGCNGDQDIKSTEVIISEKSHNGTFMAVIVKKIEKEEVYRFGIQSGDQTLLLVENNFVPLGYHQPVFELSWDKSDENVLITVDHDFGEGNLQYIFNIKNYSWQETELEN